MFKGALPGFRDFYPQELAERAHIMRTWREVARRYAFVEYDGPPLEPLDLYTKKSGEEIVGQLYNFADKGGREVALRPEMTPTVARMVAARANALRKPVRWFSMPQLFRYERQQKGRLREHYQLNVDLFGAAEVAADAELLAVALDIMRAFGLTPDDIVARVSDRRILTAYLASLGVPAGAMDAAYGVIDKLERTPRDVSSEKLAALSVPTASIDAILRIEHATIQDVAAAITGADAAVVEEFALYQQYLDALGVSAYVKFDLSIVRGLAYYTGIVFELFDRSGEFRAIAGGGRYDTLLQSLGGADLPALGFGMGDVVLGELLRARGLMKAAPERADVWLAVDETEPLERVMREAAARRAAGQSVEYALRPQSLSKQKKAAQASGANQFVTLSNDDGRNG
jgi:histidyl-tRNA synthetase